MIIELVIFAGILLLLSKFKIDFRIGEIKHLWIVVFAFAVQVLLHRSVLNNYIQVSDFVLTVVNTLTVLSPAIVLLVNYRKKGFLLSAFGVFMNTVAVAFNNGKMPVSGEAFKKVYGSELYDAAIQYSQSLTHQIMNSETRFHFFCDIIPLSKPYIFPKAVSIGDLLLFAGLVYYFYYEYRNRKYM